MITDVNDEIPAFRSKRYECEVAENAPINTPVTFIGESVPEVFDYDQVSNYLDWYAQNETQASTYKCLVSI